MKLQFKHQKFQEDAARAVADVFAGQPCRNNGSDPDFTVRSNAEIAEELSDEVILEQLNRVQRRNRIASSPGLEGRFNLTIEMETGVGKTYTYIKTMYELNKRYGWCKFIIVVPSIAVREGVYKSFQITREHFAEEYGRKIRFFIYNSARLKEIDRFASDNSMNVMIINSQAFNAKGKDSRRIYMKLDEFRSRRPIDVIARTNPILIIDEPQSVEGKQTKENLKAFHPLMTLRYSATHRQDNLYNMVYRLDAVEAYNRCLVKKIAVKGIEETKTTAADSYVYLESINLSRRAPTATIQFDVRSSSGIRKKSRRVGPGFDLFENSGELSEYRDGFVVKNIEGRDESLEFVNGIRIHAGDVIGRVSEENLRRIQIRETILSHIERERQLFYRGIKVLSLFFIDEVAHYRTYNDEGQPQNGIFARMFEEEYRDIIDNMQRENSGEAYMRYLDRISVSDTHAGYFSIDKKGHMVNQVAGDDKRARISNDSRAYDLIMKNKELLLDCDPERSPVRFIFSHSALREGWDNPNVFQICTLKQSGSDVRKRQEVGRGLRLCVNRDGERMDDSVLGRDVHQVNVLTIIASESYEHFARTLQAELAEDMKDRPDATGMLRTIIPENARGSYVRLQVNQEKLNSREFQALWSHICSKSVYTTDLDTEKLVRRAIASLNDRLYVSSSCFMVRTGQMKEHTSKEELMSGFSMSREALAYYGFKTGNRVSHGAKYDLVGRLVDETELTRKAVIRILTGIKKRVFDQLRENPEEFITKAAALIKEQKAAVMLENITYKALNEKYDTDIFTEPVMRGRPGVNAVRAKKHLFDYVICDSACEKAFAEKLEASDEVALYIKLPEQFRISTPMGDYTPGWAIVFCEDMAENLYYIAEIRDALSSGQLRPVEEAKICCAGEHFKAIGGGKVVCGTADSYESLMQKIRSKRELP